MPLPNRKGIFIVLLAMLLVVAVVVIPDKFGVGFQRYLLGGAIVILAALLYFTKRFRPGAATSKPDRYNIPPAAATRKQINLAKTAISQAEPEKALHCLLELKSEVLENAIAILSGRYAEFRRKSLLGLFSTKEETLISNQIKHDILDLIKALEQELATGTENYKIIKDYLKKRYTNRLGQKLAKRQPVNLRRISSTEGTSEERAAAFVAYSSEEVAGTMAQTFRDARGRLLLVGAPGAGKTTLMLQLVLDLLDSEPDALPVLLNLATWSSEYITLDGWLKKILPAELGVSEKYAQQIMQQDRLILLFDGFDEIREDNRASCLEAIGRYGEDAGRQFVISSRIGEYKAVAKDAPVYGQIEVGSLSTEQLEAELNRLWETENQPEARALLLAIQKDTLLRQAAETPFYFNTLQILFSGGKTLADLNFSANTLEGRQTEILERFIEYELKVPVKKEYSPEKVKHWLYFLASRMTLRNMVVFELRDLQYDWWKWKKEYLVASDATFKLLQLLILGALGGLVYGIIGGVLDILASRYLYPTLLTTKDNNFIYGISASIIFGTIIGIIVWVSKIQRYGSPEIITKEKLIWSFSDLHGVVGRIIKTSWAIFCIGWLIFEIVSDADDKIIDIVFLSITAGLLIGSITYVIQKADSDFYTLIQIHNPYQRFYASLKTLHFSIIQYWSLLVSLALKGLLPLHLVTFLNELSLRHILEFDGDPTTGTGGGAWRFRHRILQEWFAEKWVEPKKNT